MVKDTQNNVHNFFFKGKKIHASYCEKKENHCAARRYLNGFLSHEMFSSLLWPKNAFHSD